MARLSATLMALLALTVAVLAQEPTYRLRPDDVIRILVFNEAQVQALVPVGRDGNVSAPFLGSVRAQGLTIGELQKELERQYEQVLKLRNPKVSVTIERYRPVRASISGLVGRADTYEMRPGDTIMNLLARGGSFIPDRSDLRRVTLRRSGSAELIPIDLQALINGDNSQNYVLEDGDELVVPEDQKNTVSVLGAVASPGQFVYREGMRLTDALALARGDIPLRSKKSDTVVLRERPGVPGQYYRIRANIVRFEGKGDWSQNILLQRGDVVIVPFTKTPDINAISGALQSAFFLQRFFEDGLFGFRLFR